MSYKIEIVAASTAELAGKLLALAAQMQASADPVMPEVREAPKPKRKGKADDVADTATGTGTITAPEDAPQPVAQTDTAPEEQPATESAAPAAEPAPEPEAPKSLDFDKDVAPVVLRAVRERGKPWVQELLSQFGVERASQLPDDRLGELVAAITDGLEA